MSTTEFYAGVNDARLHADLEGLTNLLARRRLAGRAGIEALRVVVVQEMTRRATR